MLLVRGLGILAALPLLLVLTSCGAKSTAQGSAAGVGSLPATAATVNGQAIPTSAVVGQAFANDGYAALGHLIDYRLLDEAAAKQHIVVTAAEISAGETQMIDQLGATAFHQQLSSHDITMTLVDDKIRHQIILEKIAEQHMPAPELMLHARVMLASTRTRQQGESILKPHTDAEALAMIAGWQGQLKAGKKFANLALQDSEDTFTQGRGGDLGIIDKSSDPSGGAIWSAAQGLKAGQIAPMPVKSFMGYYLVEVISWSSAPLPTDSDRYAYAEKQYHAAALQQLEEAAMDRLRKSAKIEDTLFG